MKFIPILLVVGGLFHLSGCVRRPPFFSFRRRREFLHLHMGPRERPFFLARTFFGSGPPVGNCGRLFICRTGHSAVPFSAMGYNARNDEIRDNVTRMRREREAQRGSLATVRRFNATLSAKGYVWFWPKIAAAITSKHHWLIINCDSCGTVIDA